MKIAEQKVAYNPFLYEPMPFSHQSFHSFKFKLIQVEEGSLLKNIHYETESTTLSIFPVLKNFKIVNLQLLGKHILKVVINFFMLDGFANKTFSC